MNITHIQEDDLEFLLLSIRWSETIDRYIHVLGLNADEVEVFKSDVKAVLYVAEQYKSFAVSFILYNINMLRKRLEVLINECSQSVNYTQKIGEELGIEAQKFNNMESPELVSFDSRQN